MADDQIDRQLSAALRAQASGLGSGSPPAHRPGSPAQRGDAQSHRGESQRAESRRGESQSHRADGSRRHLPAWSVIALAVLLGALAGGLAGVISAW